uniref:Uncharacterized protein n=1 Tax=Arundo donax TaxID=35708 RepID=A0A0A9EV67_ARUDO
MYPRSGTRSKLSCFFRHNNNIDCNCIQKHCHRVKAMNLILFRNFLF